MDPPTVAEYERHAEQIAEAHAELRPLKLYLLIKQFFRDGGDCLDIGCGSGREVAWLARHGYSVLGVDAAFAMLRIARRRHSALAFVQDRLPLLASIADNRFDQSLGVAVLMHLPGEQIELAAKHMLRILKPGGHLILSYRSTSARDHRENNKLYTPIAIDELTAIFTALGSDRRFYGTNREPVRQHVWTNAVFRKHS